MAFRAVIFDIGVYSLIIKLNPACPLGRTAKYACKANTPYRFR